MINNELDSEKHPLLWVGVDFAGPFYVTLFTCCMTRAVHLELMEDLLASTFRCCLWRFFTRYEAPADRIRQCKDLSNESIKYAIQPPPDKRGLEYERIEWKLYLERALWWGRFFERMVASVKDCLRKHNVTQGCPLTNCRLCSQEWNLRPSQGRSHTNTMILKKYQRPHTPYGGGRLQTTGVCDWGTKKPTRCFLPRCLEEISTNAWLVIESRGECVATIL